MTANSAALDPELLSRASRILTVQFILESGELDLSILLHRDADAAGTLDVSA